MSYINKTLVENEKVISLFSIHKFFYVVPFIISFLSTGQSYFPERTFDFKQTIFIKNEQNFPFCVAIFANQNLRHGNNDYR